MDSAEQIELVIDLIAKGALECVTENKHKELKS